MPVRHPTHASATRGRTTGKSAGPRAEQLALFPEVVEVRPLDVRAVGGAHTRVRGVWQVRYPDARDSAPHRVFLDRHGWYCEAHGPACRAAAAARVAATPA